MPLASDNDNFYKTIYYKLYAAHPVIWHASCFAMGVGITSPGDAGRRGGRNGLAAPKTQEISGGLAIAASLPQGKEEEVSHDPDEL
jgi:hypothetical protein